MHKENIADSFVIAGLKPILEQQTPPAEEITEFDEDLKAFSEKLLEFAQKCDTPKLAGVAANQLAFEDSGERVMKNMCVVLQDDGVWQVAVNPSVYKHTENKEVSQEGCLTWPGKTIHAERNITVSIKYQDLNGNEHYRAASDFESAVWQHEINHLQGVQEIVVNPKTGRLYGPSVENGGTIISKGKIGRNDPCSCGSGKKYKKCCGR
jgi:peptide deformylase